MPLQFPGGGVSASHDVILWIVLHTENFLHVLNAPFPSAPSKGDQGALWHRRCCSAGLQVWGGRGTLRLREAASALGFSVVLQWSRRDPFLGAQLFPAPQRTCPLVLPVCCGEPVGLLLQGQLSAPGGVALGEGS